MASSHAFAEHEALKVKKHERTISSTIRRSQSLLFSQDDRSHLQGDVARDPDEGGASGNVSDAPAINPGVPVVDGSAAAGYRSSESFKKFSCQASL